jgi:hypothetical protein
LIAPVILAALALAGAHASTPVTCDPQVEQAGELGATVFASVDGGAWQPERIVLGRWACGALLLAALPAAQLPRVQAMNSALDLPTMEGAGLLVLLHEAVHASGDMDETDTECRALALVALLAARLPNWPPAALLSGARWEDSQMSTAVYHVRPCP